MITNYANIGKMHLANIKFNDMDQVHQKKIIVSQYCADLDQYNWDEKMG